MVEKENSKMFKKNYDEKKLSLAALKNLKKDTIAKKLELTKPNKLEKEKISILVLTHNRFNQLLRLLNSIYSQTYSNFEIIIIDDVSSDETYNYFKDIKDERLKYIRNNIKIDIGINRQTAYNLATGNYVVFCDDDDYLIDDNYFSDAIKIFKDKEINMVCSESYIYYENNNKYEEYELNFSGKMKSLKYLERFQYDLKKPTSTFPMIARKSALDKANLKDMKMMNDSSIYLRGLMVGGYTFVNKKRVGIYRIHNSNITSNIKVDFIIRNLEEKKYVYNYLKKQNVDFDIDKWFEEEIKLTVLYCFAGNNESEYKRKKLLFWVLRNVSYKLYKKLKEMSQEKMTKNKKIDIIRGICIIVLLLYNSYQMINKKCYIVEPYINTFALYVYFIATGYRLFNESIKKVLHKYKRIVLFFVISILSVGIYLMTKNNLGITNLISKYINADILKNQNIYNGVSLLLLTSVCYLLEIIKRIHKKALFDFCEILLLGIISLIIRNNISVCIMLYLVGRNMRHYTIEKKVRKRYLLMGIPTFILLMVESFLYKGNVYIFSVLLSIEFMVLILKVNRLDYRKLKSVRNPVLLYVIMINPITSIILNNPQKINILMRYINPFLIVLVSFIIAIPFYVGNTCIKNKKSKKRKKCLVIGYMNSNFGDDLFFKILFDRYKNVDFYMYPPSHLLEEYQEKYLKNTNVIFYDEEDDYVRLLEETGNDNKNGKDVWINIFPLICERAKKVDFYVNIGGSIFIQNEDWKKDDRFKLKDIMKDKPSFIIGCNFGPGNDEYYEYYKNWFKGFNDICFRDKESYEKFKDLENARLADDVVLIYSQKHFFHPLGYNKTIGISVLDPLTAKKIKKYSKEYYDFIISITKYYISKGFKIKLYAFCTNEGDLNAAYKIEENLTPDELKNVEVIEYQKKINKFIRKWRKSKYIIGTRFHANVLAIVHGQSFLPIVYSDKTYNYLKNIDEDIVIYDILELGKVKKDKLVYNHVTLNYSSEDQFMILDNYVKGDSK